MNSVDMAILIKAGVGVLLGVYMTLQGCRIVGPKPGQKPEYDAWFKKRGWLLYVGGPVIIVGTIILTLLKLRD